MFLSSKNTIMWNMRGMKSQISLKFTFMFCVKVPLEVGGIIMVIRRLGVVIRKVECVYKEYILKKKDG